jgi:hypothetical protein
MENCGIEEQMLTGGGHRFYYGDERKADGSHGGMGISGENHAKFYLDLAESEQQVAWKATFVDGKYVDFRDD